MVRCVWCKRDVAKEKASGWPEFRLKTDPRPGGVVYTCNECVSSHLEALRKTQSLARAGYARGVLGVYHPIGSPEYERLVESVEDERD